MCLQLSFMEVRLQENAILAVPVRSTFRLVARQGQGAGEVAVRVVVLSCRRLLSAVPVVPPLPVAAVPALRHAAGGLRAIPGAEGLRVPRAVHGVLPVHGALTATKGWRFALQECVRLLLSVIPRLHHGRAVPRCRLTRSPRSRSARMRQRRSVRSGSGSSPKASKTAENPRFRSLVPRVLQSGRYRRGRSAQVRSRRRLLRG